MGRVVTGVTYGERMTRWRVPCVSCTSQDRKPQTAVTGITGQLCKQIHALAWTLRLSPKSILKLNNTLKLQKPKFLRGMQENVCGLEPGDEFSDTGLKAQFM